MRWPNMYFRKSKQQHCIVIKFVTSILQQLNIFTRRPPTKSQGKRCVTKSRVRKQEKIIQTSVEGQRLLFIMDTCRVICHSSSRDLSFNSILHATAQNKYFWQFKILEQIVTWSSKEVIGSRKILFFAEEKRFTILQVVNPWLI